MDFDHENDEIMNIVNNHHNSINQFTGVYFWMLGFADDFPIVCTEIRSDQISEQE